MLHTPRPKSFQEIDDDDARPVPSYERLWDACFDNWLEFDPAKIVPYDWIYGSHYLGGLCRRRLETPISVKAGSR